MIQMLKICLFCECRHRSKTRLVQPRVPRRHFLLKLQKLRRIKDRARCHVHIANSIMARVYRKIPLGFNFLKYHLYKKHIIYILIHNCKSYTILKIQLSF